MNKDILVICIGRVLQIIITLVSVRVCTNLLSIAEVGNLYLINSLTAFFSLALVSPVGTYANRRMHKWAEEKSIINNFFIYNAYIFIMSCISSVLVYLLNRLLTVGTGIDTRMLMVFVMLNIYFNAWNLTIIPSLNMFNYRKSFVLFTLLTLSVGLGLSILMVKITKPLAIFWLAGQLFAQILITFTAFVYFKKIIKHKLVFSEIRKEITNENFRYITAFALPLGITTFFMWIQNQSYRLIVENTLGLEFLGVIGIGMSISANIAAAVESLAQQIYMPGFYRGINTLDHAKRAEAWNKLAQQVFPIYLSLTFMVSCLAPYLVKILTGEKFSQAYVYVIYGAWIELFRVVSNILSTIAHSEMQTKYLMKAYFAGGLFAVLGAYLAARHNGYQHSIPSALLASGCVIMLILYLDMKKVMKTNIGLVHILKSVLFSLPFGIAVLFYHQSRNYFISILMVMVFGTYFLIVQYKNSNLVVKGKLRYEY